MPYTLQELKPVFHSNARNARKALRKEKYASKIKSGQQTQENYVSKKQKYASASHATDASGPCTRKHNTRIDSIFYATQVLELRAFEWKPGLSPSHSSHPVSYIMLSVLPHPICTTSVFIHILHIL